MASDGNSSLLCFIKTEYVANKTQEIESATSVSLPRKSNLRSQSGRSTELEELLPQKHMM